MRAGPRNSKLECFLKRSLSVERYERLRAYDSCIVDRKWRYLVLGDQCIYLTENPPRTLRKAVLYRDLKAARLVCDFPDFLRGQEREDTLHIALIYHKRKWPKKSPSSISLLNSSRNAQLQKRRTSSTGQYLSHPVDINPGRHRKASLDETMLHNLSRMDLHLHNYGDTLSSSMPSKLFASQKQNSFPMANLVECEATNLAQGDSKDQVALVNKCMVGCNFMKKGSSKKKNKQDDTKLTDAFVKPQEENVALNTVLCRRLPQLSTPANRNRPTMWGSQSPVEQQECILDVYMLSHNSPMLAIIQCAWENYLIRSTFQAEEDDEEEEENAITDIQPVSKQPELLFVQLKLELLTMSPSNCSVERMQTLCSKLQLYADTYFVVKRIFWKDSELLQLFVGILQKFLPSYYSEENIKEQSLVIQILDILQTMFRETENVSERLKTLETSQSSIGDLLNLIAHFSSSQNELSLPLTSSSRTSQTQDDLSSELIKMFIALLFELFLCAQQKFVESQKLNVVWMVNQLEETGCEELIQQVVNHTLHLTQPRGKGNCLNPTQVLQLYQQGYILLTLLDHSTKLTELIRSNYFTEFKYLVQRHVLEQKIPTHYPLLHTLLTVIDKVLDKILN